MPTSGLAGYDLQIINAASVLVLDTSYASSAQIYSIALSGFSETTYSVRVRARSNAGAIGAWSSSVNFAFDFTPPNGVPTLVSPISGTETSVTAVSFEVTSVSDTGPGGTNVYYIFQTSRSSTFDTSTILSTQRMGATKFTPTWLFNDSGAYWWRVAAMDTVGNIGSFSNPDSFTRPIPIDTVPPVPIAKLSPTADDLLGVTLIWEGSPSTDMTSGGQYNIYWNEGITGAMPDTIFKIVPNIGTESYIYSTLVDTTLRNGVYYRFKVKAQDRVGNEEDNNSVVGATARLGASNYPWIEIITPHAEHTVNMTGRVQVQARIRGSYRSICDTLILQFRNIQSSAWSTMTPVSSNWSNPNYVGGESKTVYGIHWDAAGDGGQSDSNYELRGIAVINTGDSNPSLSEVIQITLTTNSGDADINSGTDSTEQRGYSGQRNSVNHESGEDTKGGVEFAAGATGENGEDTITVSVGIETTAGRGAHGQSVSGLGASGLAVSAIDNLIGSDTPLGIGLTIEIRNKSGQVITALIQDALISMSYRMDTSYSLDSLVIRALHANGDTQEWSYDSVTNLPSLTAFAYDTIERLITFKTRKFSSFVLVAPALGSGGPGNQVNLAKFMVYPNPYRPNDGNASTGQPYDPANPRTTGIIFDNLPAQVRVEVYTMRGERVFERTMTVNDGYLTWNAKNSANGDDVASGYYIYIVTDLATGRRVTGKLAVIR